VSAVEVPRDYVPTTAILFHPDAGRGDLFVRIVDGIAAKNRHGPEGRDPPCE